MFIWAVVAIKFGCLLFEAAANVAVCGRFCCAPAVLEGADVSEADVDCGVVADGAVALLLVAVDSLLLPLASGRRPNGPMF